MEQKRRFKFYASKAPIWWSKMSEDRPSKAYFSAFSFDWQELVGFNISWVSQFKGDIVLADDIYTYFKMEDTEKNVVTYWFVDDKIRQLTKGCLYQLGLDIWSSYNIDLLDELPDNYLLGVERTHLTIADYKKYNVNHVLDDFLNIGHYGDEAYKIPPPFEISSQGEWTNVYKFLTSGEVGLRGYRAYGTKRRLNGTTAVIDCYVFSNWSLVNDNTVVWGAGSKDFLIMPVIDTGDDYYAELSGDASLNDGTALGAYLGNTAYFLQKLVKQKPTYFIGRFLLPLLPPQGYVRHTETIDNKKYDYLAIAYSVTGEYKNEYIRSIETKIIGETWKYNGDGIGLINAYGFFNSNAQWYGNVISPLLIFNQVDYFEIRIKGYSIFNMGMVDIANSKDIIRYGSQLPVNKESYFAYYKGIENSMNTAIKVSKDNAILGAVKGGFNAITGVAQSSIGLVTGDVIGAVKGWSNATNSIFNLAGSIVNHVNTIATFKAQIEDAKNSVQPSYASTADADMKLYLILKQQSNTGMFPLKKFTAEGKILNNNLAFLFGVKVSNYIPFSVIKKMQTYKNNPCLYLELQTSFVTTNLSHYLSRKFPWMNNKMKGAILDAWRKGYRIWNVDCDLSQEYSYDISA